MIQCLLSLCSASALGIGVSMYRTDTISSLCPSSLHNLQALPVPLSSRSVSYESALQADLAPLSRMPVRVRVQAYPYDCFTPSKNRPSAFVERLRAYPLRFVNAFSPKIASSPLSTPNAQSSKLCVSSRLTPNAQRVIHTPNAFLFFVRCQSSPVAFPWSPTFRRPTRLSPARLLTSSSDCPLPFLSFTLSQFDTTPPVFSSVLSKFSFLPNLLAPTASRPTVASAQRSAHSFFSLAPSGLLLTGLLHAKRPTPGSPLLLGWAISRALHLAQQSARKQSCITRKVHRHDVHARTRAREHGKVQEQENSTPITHLDSFLHAITLACPHAYTQQKYPSKNGWELPNLLSSPIEAHQPNKNIRQKKQTRAALLIPWRRWFGAQTCSGLDPASSRRRHGGLFPCVIARHWREKNGVPQHREAAAGTPCVGVLYSVGLSAVSGVACISPESALSSPSFQHTGDRAEFLASDAARKRGRSVGLLPLWPVGFPSGLSCPVALAHLLLSRSRARNKYNVPFNIHSFLFLLALDLSLLLFSLCVLFSCFVKEVILLKKIHVVNAGVDTLVLNAYYLDDQNQPMRRRELDAEFVDRLNAWKQQAQDANEPYPTDFTFRGAQLLMLPNGAGRGQWQWMLKTPDITLYISRGLWNGIASVRLNSEFLWSRPTLTQAIVDVHALLYEVFHHEILHVQPSSIDLCADIAGWEDVEKLNKKRNFVSHSRKRRHDTETDAHEGLKASDHSYGLRDTGFDFSSRGPMSLTMYDKTRYIKQDGKTWFLPLWQAHGWDQEKEPEVWRVEAKFKRDVFRDLTWQDRHGIEDAYEVEALLPLLWAYAVGHVGGGTDGLPDGWLRCVRPGKDSNRARWINHPAWDVVQGAFSLNLEHPPHFGTIIRKAKEEHNIEKGLAAILGYATSLSAWVGDELASPDADLSIFLHWLAESGQQHLQKKERDFALEVSKKRVKIGKQKLDNSSGQIVQETIGGAL